MATSALAQETVFALRRKIAKIEGRLAEHFGAVEKDAAGEALLRRHGLVRRERGSLATGAERFDAALGGGLPEAALTEIHGLSTRDAAAAAGFILAVMAASLGPVAAPMLWIGTSEVFREAGFPYAPGILSLYNIDPAGLMLAQTPKLADRRGSRAAEGVFGGAPRNSRQPFRCGSCDDTAAAFSRPRSRSPRVSAAPGRPPRADSGARPACGVIRALRAAAHLRWSAHRLDRPSWFYNRHQQEPNLAANAIHVGMEPS
jgi:hypothetical protein